MLAKENISEHGIHHTNYVKIWAILVVLLAVSVVGPWAGIRIVTLVCAFGVALVKAYLVAKNFMHVNMERRWIPYLLLMFLIFIVALFAGVAPDVMKHEGQRWDNYSAKQSVEAGQHAAAAHE
jgi:caa(3)-type oxidase subunit IV